MSSVRLLSEVVSIEIRKTFSYRADFWIGFIVSTCGRVGLGYFLWKSVYDYQGATTISGLTFSQILLYTVLAYLVDQAVRNSTFKASTLSREIYDGTLTRYLIYPVQVLPYKMAMTLSQTLVGIIQLFLGIGFYALLFGFPTDPTFSISAFTMGILTFFPAVICFFLMTYILEMVAFWADNVWSLNVMLRFISGFLGGGLLPLDLYPASVQQILHWLPFYHITGVPANLLMGRLGFSDMILSWGLLIVWSVFLYGIIQIIWSRGLKKFSGVGI